MIVALILVGLASLSQQEPSAPIVILPDSGTARSEASPVEITEPPRSRAYRIVSRLVEPQDPPAVVFIGANVEYGQNRLVEVLIVSARPMDEMASGLPSHARAWYEIDCTQNMMRTTLARFYDPDDVELPKHERSYSHPMGEALSSETRYPDLLIRPACEAGGGGMSFDDAVTAIAYARGRSR